MVVPIWNLTAPLSRASWWKFGSQEVYPGASCGARTEIRGGPGESKLGQSHYEVIMAGTWKEGSLW